jgi:hypothetical protein
MEEYEYRECFQNNGTNYFGIFKKPSWSRMPIAQTTDERLAARITDLLNGIMTVALVDNAEPSASFDASIMISRGWIEVQVLNVLNECVAEMTLEMYNGKVTARIYNEEDYGGDPSSEHCLNEINDVVRL